MGVRQSGGFLGVAPLARVVLLLSAWPYRLLAFPAWARFGWVAGRCCQVIAEDCRCLAGVVGGLDIAGGEVLTMSRLGIRALS